MQLNNFKKTKICTKWLIRCVDRDMRIDFPRRVIVLLTKWQKVYFCQAGSVWTGYTAASTSIIMCHSNEHHHLERIAAIAACPPRLPAILSTSAWHWRGHVHDKHPGPSIAPHTVHPCALVPAGLWSTHTVAPIRVLFEPATHAIQFASLDCSSTAIINKPSGSRLDRPIPKAAVHYCAVMGRS